MNKKTYLEAPLAELIVVRFEEAFLQASLTVNRNSHTEIMDIDDDDDNL